MGWTYIGIVATLTGTVLVGAAPTRADVRSDSSVCVAVPDANEVGVAVVVNITNIDPTRLLDTRDEFGLAAAERFTRQFIAAINAGDIDAALDLLTIFDAVDFAILIGS